MQIISIVVAATKLIKTTDPRVWGPFPNSVGLEVFIRLLFGALETRILKNGLE